MTSQRKQGEKPIEGHLADLGSDPGTLCDRDRQQVALLVHHVLTKRIGVLIQNRDGLHYYQTKNEKTLPEILAEIATEVVAERQKDFVVKVLVDLEKKGVIMPGPNANPT